MASITSTGPVLLGFSGWDEKLVDLSKQVFGENVDLTPTEIIPQLNSVIAIALDEAEGAVLQVYNARNLNAAEGDQLDVLISPMNIPRRRATASVANVTMTGTAGTVIPAGSRVQSILDDIFLTSSSVTLDGSGMGMVRVQSQENGAIRVNAGDINRIVDSEAGWATVNNPVDGLVGFLEEDDANYLHRYRNVVAKNSNSSFGSLRSQLLSLEGIQKVNVYENDTPSSVTVQGLTVTAYSTATAVYGTSYVGVSDVLREVKTAGSPTVGTTSVSRTDGADINYTRANLIPLQVAITVDTQTDFISNGDEEITTQITNYVNALEIGDAIHDGRIVSDIYRVANHTISSLKINKKSAPNVDDVTYGDASLFRQEGANTGVEFADLLTLAAADVTVTLE